MVTDANGEDITDLVVVIPGSITVTKTTTTTTTDVTTSTTTETTTISETETSTTSETETSTSSVTETSTTGVTETSTSSVTETSTTGETETSTSSVTETSITSDTETSTSSVTETSTTSDTETSTTSDTETSTTSDTETSTTSETETSTTSDTETTTSSVTETSTTSETETSTTSETDTTTTETTTSGTTDTTTIVYPYTYAEGTVVDGFYFNHDPRPFNIGHVSGGTENGNGSLVIVTKYEDGTSEKSEIDTNLVTFKEVRSGADNPQGAFDVDMESQEHVVDDFIYTVEVHYNGALLTYEDGTPVTFKAFIGVKGDANFDMAVNAADASSALGYYAKTMTMTDGMKRSDIRLAPASCKLVDEEPMLDELAAFLVDVTEDVYSADNWKATKDDEEKDADGNIIVKRLINAVDASYVLKFYSMYSTMPDAEKATADRQKLWNDTILDREEKMNETLLPYKS